MNVMPCHTKDLHPHYKMTASGEDNHKGASSDCESRTLLLNRIWSDDSLIESEETVRP